MQSDYAAIPQRKGSEMLSLLSRRPARIGRIHAEAEALICDFRDEAYSKALSREHKANSDALAKYWSRVALAVAHKTGRRDDLYLTTRAAMNAPREPRRPNVEPKPAAEPKGVILRRATVFRIQFVGATLDRGSAILKEVQIQTADVSAAIIAAANTQWPPRTIGLRILDREGREVFARQKADRRQGIEAKGR